MSILTCGRQKPSRTKIDPSPEPSYATAFTSCRLGSRDNIYDVGRLLQQARRGCRQPTDQCADAARLAHPELISLAAGFVDQVSLPVDETREAIDMVLKDVRHAQAALQYGTPAGFLPLREAVRAHLFENDGDALAGQHLSVDQVVMTAGSNELLHLLVDTLCNPGDIVLCPEPTYFVFLGILHNIGVARWGWPRTSRASYPRPSTRSCAARRGRRVRPGEGPVRRFLLRQSERGHLGRGRRAPVVDTIKCWSRQGTIRIIEDAAYRELRYTGDDVPSLRSYDPEGDTVILTETFSKSFSPGIRVGWGFLPRDLIEPVANQKGNIDFGSPNLSQHLMAAVMEAGLLRPHIEKLRDHYREAHSYAGRLRRVFGGTAGRELESPAGRNLRLAAAARASRRWTQRIVVRSCRGRRCVVRAGRVFLSRSAPTPART